MQHRAIAGSAGGSGLLKEGEEEVKQFRIQRLYPKFGIRDLLWLAVVIALAVRWHAERKQLIFDVEQSRIQKVAAEEKSRAEHEEYKAAWKAMEKEEFRKRLYGATKE